MPEQAVLTIIGILIGALFAVIGFVVSAIWSKVAALEKSSGEDAGNLAAFIARFDSTEKAWESWREDFESDHTRRRAEIDKRLDAHAEDIKKYGTRLTRLERNGG